MLVPDILRNGYYDVFIPAMRRLSPTYDSYYVQMLKANEQFMKNHPELIEEAYTAMFGSLDEHSDYYTSEEYEYFTENIFKNSHYRKTFNPLCTPFGRDFGRMSAPKIFCVVFEKH